MKTYIEEFGVSNNFFTNYFNVDGTVIQTDSKGQPLIKIKCKSNIPLNHDGLRWLRDKFYAKQL